jgi:hypothetical protein
VIDWAYAWGTGNRSAVIYCIHLQRWVESSLLACLYDAACSQREGVLIRHLCTDECPCTDFQGFARFMRVKMCCLSCSFVKKYASLPVGYHSPQLTSSWRRVYNRAHEVGLNEISVQWPTDSIRLSYHCNVSIGIESLPGEYAGGSRNGTAC